MIAKGLDYPNVTLVGVISGDTALALPDFRSRRSARFNSSRRWPVGQAAPRQPRLRGAANLFEAGRSNDSIPYQTGLCRVCGDGTGPSPRDRVAAVFADGARRAARL